MNREIEQFKYDKKRVAEFLHEKVSIIPSLITSISICFGMQAFYFILKNRIEYSILCICISAIIDGVDGKIARYLNSTSEFGKTIDSLADFLSFSISPALIIYIFRLRDWASLGWSCCVFFVLGMAFRLARFSSQPSNKESFTGIPAPAAGLLAFLPIAVEKTFDIVVPNFFFALNLFLIALGMVGKFKTIAINKIKISKSFINTFFIAFSIIVVLAMSYIWLTAIAVAIIYIIHILVSLYKYKLKRHDQTATQ
ncbi:MAG: CDP-alcohol phosphatidyltransferase family protein [Alphaproteobacteria bacterium]|nr:MAG: CDP-alcohol phosphatidyltransferase family protein [Alphaproteobacteria bacterium]